MRFASLGGSGNFAQAGVAAGREGSKILNAVRNASPDFGSLAEKQMNIKAKQNVAQIKADASVEQANINADAKIAVAKEDIKQDNIIKGSRRKAGVVAAMGKAGMGMADAFMGKPEKRDHSASLALQEKLTSSAESIRAGIKPVDFSALTSKPDTTNTGGTGASSSSNTEGGLISSGQALSAGKGTAGKGGKYDLNALTNYAIQGGFSPENAKTMAAISMGESGGNAGIDTVMSGLDPNQTNEFSVGLAQINVQAHGDKLSRRGWTEADLRDPVKNMTIAKEVYDEVGSFKPWSVYQKGLHHQYLQ